MLTGFFGIMSSGKGVMSTVFLRWAKSQNPKRVIANCWLKEDKLDRLTTDELYIKSRTPEYFRDSYLYITELHSIIDARRSGSLLNTNFTQFLTQVGKLNCDVIYDSQLMDSQIDLRMREFTTLRFYCERWALVKNKLINAALLPRILNVQVAIKMYLETVQSDGTSTVKKLGFYLPEKDDYDYFDTTEIVTLDREKFMRK